MSNMQQGFFWDLDTLQWCVFVGKSMWTLDLNLQAAQTGWISCCHSCVTS